jgi:exonuclease III
MRFICPAFLFVASILFARADTECPTVPTVPEDRRATKDTLRIVQYNVEWLFIDYYSAFGCPGENCTWKNETEAMTHLNYVADVVKTLSPDILNLCEVEGCDELNLLTDRLDGSFRSYLKKGTDTSTGQNVGMITRIDPNVNLYRSEARYTYPLPNSACNYTGAAGSTGVSKHYITEYYLTMPSGPKVNLALIGAHLLANPKDPTRCAEREAQAQVLQNIVHDYIGMDYEVILIGDFNDFDAEILDLNDNKPTSMVLDILKGYSGEYAGKYQLYSVAEVIPKSERFSDWWDPNNDCVAETEEFSMIDHILVTDFIRGNIKNVFVYHGYDEFCGKYNSDHYPLVIDF